MAFTVEDVSMKLAKGGEVTDEIKQQAAEIVKMHDEDIQGLKGTNQELKDEKTKLKEKYNGDIAAFADKEKGYQEQVQQLKDQLAKGDDGSQKQYYEAEMARKDSDFKIQLSNRDKQLADATRELNELKAKEVKRDQESAFMDVLRTTNADPATYDMIKTLMLGDGSKFALHNTSDGNIYWATDGSGETFRNRLDKFLGSDQGKRFVKFGNSGANAEGSAKTVSNYGKPNPFKKETLNVTEQARLFREEPENYKILKAQAAQG